MKSFPSTTLLRETHKTWRGFTCYSRLIGLLDSCLFLLMFVGWLAWLHVYSHMREAEIITDLDINNIDCWSTLSLKTFTLSGVDSQHLPVIAAVALRKRTLKSLTALPGDHFVIWGTPACGKVTPMPASSRKAERDKLHYRNIISFGCAYSSGCSNLFLGLV